MMYLISILYGKADGSCRVELNWAAFGLACASIMARWPGLAGLAGKRELLV